MDRFNRKPPTMSIRFACDHSFRAPATFDVPLRSRLGSSSVSNVHRRPHSTYYRPYSTCNCRLRQPTTRGYMEHVPPRRTCKCTASAYVCTWAPNNSLFLNVSATEILRSCSEHRHHTLRDAHFIVCNAAVVTAAHCVASARALNSTSIQWRLLSIRGFTDRSNCCLAFRCIAKILLWWRHDSRNLFVISLNFADLTLPWRSFFHRSQAVYVYRRQSVLIIAVLKIIRFFSSVVNTDSQ